MSTSVRARDSKALYLPGVESNPKPGLYKDLIDSARGRNAEYSKIWDLFAFQPWEIGRASCRERVSIDV